jgi:hypothetical protein
MKSVFRNLLLAGVLALPATLAHAVSNRYYQVVDGNLGVYLEVMPEAPRPEGQYRILVALFERAAGVRIKDAQVTATVSGNGLAEASRKLELTVTTSSVTYGNRFTLPQPGRYRVRLVISRPGEPRPIDLVFDVERPS